MIALIFISASAQVAVNSWTTVEPPSGDSHLDRAFHVAIPLVNQLFVFGGLFDAEPAYETSMGDSYFFNSDSNSWIMLSSAENPPPRYAAASAAINSTHLLMFGGLSGAHTYVQNDTWLFNGVTAQWSQLFPPVSPPALWGSAAAGNDSVVIMFGGFTSVTLNADDDDQEGLTPTDNLWLFDTATMTWTNMTEFSSGALPVAVGMASALIVNQTLYLVAGCTSFAIPCTTKPNCQDSICGDPQNTTSTLSLGNWSWTSVEQQGSMLPSGLVAISPTMPNDGTFAAYMPVPNAAYFNGYASTVLVFHASNSTWSQVQFHPVSPAPIGRFGASLTLVNDLLLFFGGTDQIKDCSMFTISIVGSIWTPIEDNFVPQPRLSGTTSLVNGSILVFGGMGLESLNDMWLIDPAAQIWQQYPYSGTWPSPRFSHACVVIGQTMFLFGGHTNEFSPLIAGDCWSLDLGSFLWTLRNCSNAPSARFGHGMVALATDAILLYSGMNGYSLLNDTWIWNITTDVWEQVISKNNPGPRALFSLARLSSTIVAFAGKFPSPTTDFYLNDTWGFDVETRQWRELVLSNSSFQPFAFAAPATTMIGCNKMVVIGGVSAYGILVGSTLTGSFLSDGTWEWQTVDAYDLYARQYHSSVNLGQADDYCLQSNSDVNMTKDEVYVAFGAWSSGALPQIEYLQSTILGCNAGSFAPNASIPCAFCAQGSYAPTAGSTECLTCSIGVTTNSTGSTLLSDCSICEPGYCAHDSSCIVTLAIEAECDCPFYLSSSSKCSSLSVIAVTLLSTVGALVIVGVIVAVGRGWWRRMRTQNNRLASLLSTQNEEFESSWRIPASDITFSTKLGEGGYGEVWQGLWGDRPVAVKKLLTKWSSINDDDLLPLTPNNHHIHTASARTSLLSDSDQAHKGFEKEIHFLRKIKHINIVLCFGAGVDDDACRFLVLELCSRGSLRNVLQNSEAEWPWFRQMETALHIARGIGFLHSMKPISIHRDLKSPNILISEGWIAKIADFGSTKLLEDKPEPAKRENRNENVGSLLWTAPEIFNHQKYSTSSDMYSFGMILWEIVSRKLPFENLRFNHQIEEAVKEGRRPIIPEVKREEYSNLIHFCWNHDPKHRPTIDEVIKQLEMLNQTSASRGPGMDEPMDREDASLIDTLAS